MESDRRPTSLHAGAVARAVDASLARIAARDSELRAWKYIDPDAVRRVATERDSLPATRRGALHGMLIGVKDNSTRAICRPAMARRSMMGIGRALTLRLSRS
jgi:Asp-tRNA(Asn)/Glu-tRNA(Gln) amidotransferase A subunit family amidase